MNGTGRGVSLTRDLAAIAFETESLESVLSASLDLICRRLDWPIAHLILEEPTRPDTRLQASVLRSVPSPEYEEVLHLIQSGRHDQTGTVVSEVITGGKAVWYPDLSADPRFRTMTDEGQAVSALVFPLPAEGRVLGVIEMYGLGRPNPGPAVLKELERAGRLLARLLARAQLDQQVIDLALQEQSRIGQELHDTVGQQVTALDMMVSSLKRQLREGRTGEAAASVAKLQDVVRETKSQVRALSRGIIPIDMNAGGLPEALDDLAEQTREVYDVECKLHRRGLRSLEDPFVCTQLLRIAQEGILNAVKHGEPGRIDLSLLTSDGRGMLEVVNDGAPLQAPSGDDQGAGMRIMRHRAGLIGATLTLSPESGGGARLRCEFSLQSGLTDGIAGHG